MLKKIRVVLAALFLVGITLLFIGIGHNCWGWMARLQFLPSLLALNLGVVMGIVLLTLLFGRIYCSVICPMGVFQDLVIWIRRKYLLAYNEAIPTVRQADHCIACRRCERDCPQNIRIPDELRRIDRYIESLKRETIE